LGSSTTTWTWVDIADADLISGDSLLVTGTAATGDLTIATGGDGKYLVIYSISGSQNQAGGTLQSGIELNGTMQLNGKCSNSSTANVQVCLSGTLELNLVATNTIHIAMAFTGSGSATYTCNAVTLIIHRIGN